MNVEKASRIVICSLSTDTVRTEGNGRLNVYFEVIGKEIFPINKAEYFCDTSQVFVLNSFSEIQANFKGRLFMVEASPSDNEVTVGNCSYVVKNGLNNCKELRNFSIAEVIEHALPNPNEPTIERKGIPLTRLVFLREDSFIYGPFEFKSKPIDSEDGAFELSLQTPTTTPFSAKKRAVNKGFVISKIDTDLIEDSLTNSKSGSVTLVPVTKNLALKREAEVDFITDEQVIKSIGELIQTRPGKRWASNRELQNLQKEAKGHDLYKEAKDRFEQFFEIVSNLDNWDTTRNKLINDYFLTDKGRESINRHINDNKEVYFSELKAELLEKVTTEISDKVQEVNDFKEQLDDIQEEIRDKKEELSRREKQLHENTESDEIRKKVALENQKFQEELDKSNEELSRVKEQLEQYDSFEKLKKDKKDLEDEYQVFQKLKHNLEDDVEQQTDKLLANMVKLKPQMDALLGTPVRDKTSAFNFSVKHSKDQISASDYVSSVAKAIRSHGRETDFNQVANLLITVAQSQFTLFSGQPGTGKTSMAQLLGKVTGLDSRLLTVPVAKGWTSTRDILGFYNTLSQTYQPSSSGLYELLEHLNKENSGTPAFVLLDEFNLSQPEHYLSNFLEMADEGSQRKINTGEPSNILTVPSYLRFIGTLNSVSV
ncbi:AAA family ATPase [Vibrio pomeroyi]|uniref:AAA family ATPase n=1 Tax=Vibrio pomeroyi TaxID=198832 RepID=A0ABV4N1J0_9VIBR